jgi:hypothetical protein
MLFTPVVSACGEDTNTFTDSSCRQGWADLRQLQGENSNPAPEGTALAHVWDAEYDHTADLEEAATAADCPEALSAQEVRFDSLIDLAWAANSDMLVVLQRAEWDLEHAIATRDYDPLPRRLARAFTTLRREAPDAHRAVAAELAALAAVDLEDPDAVEAAINDLQEASDASEAARTCRKALRVIGRYELDEE